jgi:hypothetical protein
MQQMGAEQRDELAARGRELAENGHPLFQRILESWDQVPGLPMSPSAAIGQYGLNFRDLVSLDTYVMLISRQINSIKNANEKYRKIKSLHLKHEKYFFKEELGFLFDLHVTIRPQDAIPVNKDICIFGFEVWYHRDAIMQNINDDLAKDVTTWMWVKYFPCRQPLNLWQSDIDKSMALFDSLCSNLSDEQRTAILLPHNLHHEPPQTTGAATGR